MCEEAEGFGSVVGVVEGNLIKRGVLVWRDYGEDGVAQEREVLRALGLAPHTTVFAPQSGILFPVSFIFHRPVATGDLSKQCMACLSFTQAGNEVAGFALEVTGTFLVAVKASEAHQLPRSGEQGEVQIE